MFIIYFVFQMVKYCSLCLFMISGNKLLLLLTNISIKHWARPKTQKSAGERNLWPRCQEVQVVLLGRPNFIHQADIWSVMRRPVLQEHRAQVRRLKFDQSLDSGYNTVVSVSDWRWFGAWRCTEGRGTFRGSWPHNQPNSTVALEAPIVQTSVTVGPATDR